MFSFDFMTLVNKIQWGWIFLCLLAAWFAYWQIQGWRLAHRRRIFASPEALSATPSTVLLSPSATR